MTEKQQKSNWLKLMILSPELRLFRQFFGV